jgi:hypothetical protein
LSNRVAEQIENDITTSRDAIEEANASVAKLQKEMAKLNKELNQTEVRLQDPCSLSVY